MVDRVVYSTEQGKMCPECQQAVARCRCRRPQAVTAATGVVSLSRETKGRQGKCVTLVRGVALEADALAQLAKTLRTLCGSGGTVKDGVIELQGEHRDRVSEALTRQGWVVRRVGG
ncbi:MAG: stress response translation initiation inhibitor YciH [Magnetococcales bacterium]|nr:stress response translation initiation inhibitor YciH [Magnetococcales bacterium]